MFTIKTFIEYKFTYCVQIKGLFNEHQNRQLPNQSQIQNLINLIERLFDKLYDGLYLRDPRELFESLVKLQSNLKKKSNYAQDQLINAINRTLLYKLSRPCFDLTEQVIIIIT